MIAIGEQTGQLESMLLRAANSYEMEVSALVSGLASILEPILILFLAVIVGTILASVMLPMLEMSSLAM
jgi:type IV pilus assembly protein PilC